MVGRQTPLLALFVPLIAGVHRRPAQARHPGRLAGRAGLRRAFAVVQFVTSNYISVPLTDIVAALLSAPARSSLFLRVWQPAGTYVEDEPESTSRSRSAGMASPRPRAPRTAA